MVTVTAVAGGRNVIETFGTLGDYFNSWLVWIVDFVSFPLYGGHDQPISSYIYFYWNQKATMALYDSFHKKGTLMAMHSKLPYIRSEVL